MLRALPAALLCSGLNFLFTLFHLRAHPNPTWWTYVTWCPRINTYELVTNVDQLLQIPIVSITRQRRGFSYRSAQHRVFASVYHFVAFATSIGIDRVGSVLSTTEFHLGYSLHRRFVHRDDALSITIIITVCLTAYANADLDVALSEFRLTRCSVSPVWICGSDEPAVSTNCAPLPWKCLTNVSATMCDVMMTLVSMKTLKACSIQGRCAQTEVRLCIVQKRKERCSCTVSI